MHPVYAALSDLSAARAAFLSLRGQRTQRTLVAGGVGGKIGAVVGSFLLPGLGTVIGGFVGGAIGGAKVGEQETVLVVEFQERVKAFYAVEGSTWDIVQREIQDRFRVMFGETLQQMARQIEAARAERLRPPFAPVFERTSLPPSLAPARRRWPVALAALVIVAITGATTWFVATRTAGGRAPNMSGTASTAQ
jgi:hypothetical protein